MIEDLQLAGLRPCTQDSYVRAVSLLARYHGRSPDTLSEEEVRAFLLCELNEKRLAPSTLRVHLYGIRFFYRHTLRRELPLLDLVRPAKRRKLPLALAHDEVKRALSAVRKTCYRTALATVYSCGLRVSEVCALQVTDVLGAQGQLRVVDSKGGVDRLVPLPARTLELLRDHYRQSRPPRPWVFGDKRGAGPMRQGTLQKVFKDAVRDSGGNGAASIHTLRHSYATNLLVAGVDLTVVQRWLGHRSIVTTTIYTHVVERVPRDYLALVNDLMADL
jgi:site-specific recombinase XerD